MINQYGNVVGLIRALFQIQDSILLCKTESISNGELYLNHPFKNETIND